MREAVAQKAPIAASVLAFAEIHATFARRRREGLLLAPEFEEIRRRLAEAAAAEGLAIFDPVHGP